MTICDCDDSCRTTGGCGNIVYYWPPRYVVQNQGWACPVCNKENAPWSAKCEHCNQITTKWTRSVPIGIETMPQGITC